MPPPSTTGKATVNPTSPGPRATKAIRPPEPVFRDTSDLSRAPIVGGIRGIRTMFLAVRKTSCRG
jgi:hypothetical protein